MKVCLVSNQIAAFGQIGGFGTAGFSNMQTTLMLTEAPSEMRSRLMGLVTVGIGTGPLLPVASVRNNSNPELPNPFVSSFAINRARPR